MMTKLLLMGLVGMWLLVALVPAIIKRQQHRQIASVGRFSNQLVALERQVRRLDVNFSVTVTSTQERLIAVPTANRISPSTYRRRRRVLLVLCSAMLTSGVSIAIAGVTALLVFAACTGLLSIYLLSLIATTHKPSLLQLTQPTKSEIPVLFEPMGRVSAGGYS